MKDSYQKALETVLSRHDARSLFTHVDEQDKEEIAIVALVRRDGDRKTRVVPASGKKSGGAMTQGYEMHRCVSGNTYLLG